MKQSILKPVRVIISLLFFTLIALLLLDYRNIFSQDWFQTILFPQFVPSIIHFITVPAFLTAGFIIILIITVLFGRVYCSSLCPIGTLQDFIIRLSKKLKVKKYFKYTKPETVLRYSILGVTLLFTIFGSLFLVNLLDPFANFGRFTVTFAKPVLLLGNNLTASVLEEFDIYSVYPADIKGLSFWAFVIPVLMFVKIFTMSMMNGRIYCNTVCPVGTLLGFVSKFSLFKIAVDNSNCNSCGICGTKCKSGCIDTKAKTVDMSRCVACYNCIDACPSGGIRYQFLPKESESANTTSFQKPRIETKELDAPNQSKRKFIYGTLSYVLGAAIISRAQQIIQPTKPSTVPENRESFSSPPGSLGIEHFNDKCIACRVCVSACPTKVLQPSFLEFGFFNMSQPYMDYHTAYCNFDCTVCGEVCPTGAILPVTQENKKTVQIGQVNFIKDNCIVETENTDCGACSEHCPTKAVYMIPYKKINGKDIFIPEINNKLCVGCGACEYACPTRPYRAIFVNGSEIHGIAEKPKEEKIQDETPEEFPF